MGNKSKYLEKFIHEIWINQKFKKFPKTFDGKEIVILNSGEINKNNGGADFTNAKIKIGGEILIGDVEIDSFYSDWKTHGHHINKLYNNVILHLTLQPDPSNTFVKTENDRKIPSVSIESILENNIKKEIRSAIISERQKRKFIIPCSDKNHIVEKELRLKLIFSIGLERFKKKTERLFLRLKELAYLKQMNINEPVISYELQEDFFQKDFIPDDFNNQLLWNQILYEGIFEALGYSLNKDMMLKIAQSVNIEFLSKYKNDEDFLDLIESVFFQIAGLLPDVYNLPDEETTDYTKLLFSKWNQIKFNYDGEIFNEINWKFYGQRPQNFPTLRIAGGSRILYKIIKEDFTSKLIHGFINLTTIEDCRKFLRKLIIISAEGYWKNHFVFDKVSDNKSDYFIGKSRADEIIINVILPFLTLYFEIFNKTNERKKVLEVYSNLQQDGGNSLTENLGRELGVKDFVGRSIYYQGIIELYKTKCSKELCKECEIGKKVFN